MVGRRAERSIAEFHRLLGESMRYDRTVVQKYFVDGDEVAAIFVGSGVAHLTGRPFESEILRLYTLEKGIVAVNEENALHRASCDPKMPLSAHLDGRRG